MIYQYFTRQKRRSSFNTYILYYIIMFTLRATYVRSYIAYIIMILTLRNQTCLNDDNYSLYTTFKYVTYVYYCQYQGLIMKLVGVILLTELINTAIFQLRLQPISNCEEWTVSWYYICMFVCMICLWYLYNYVFRTYVYSNMQSKIKFCYLTDVANTNIIAKCLGNICDEEQ